MKDNGTETAMKRESMVFYRNFYEAIQELPAEEREPVYRAVFAYALEGIGPELDGAAGAAFEGMRPHLDANARRYDAAAERKKRKGGAE